jgi:putative peptidoglycan lipid II flippase
MALTIPMFFGDFLVGGTIFFAFIPLFIDWKIKKGEAEAWRLAINFMFMILLIMSLCTVIYFIFARQIISLIAPGFSKETLDLTVQIARFLSPTVLIFCLTIMLRSLLYTYKEFIVTSVASLLYPLFVIILVLLLAHKISIYSLVWGSLVGAHFQFIMQFFQAWKLNCCRKFRLSLVSPDINKILILSLPLVGTMITFQINQVVVIRLLASTLEEGSIATLNYAYQLINTPLAILAMSIGTAFFPDISEKISQMNFERAREIFSTGIRMTLFLIIPLSAGLVILSYPITKVIFERGSFTAASTLVTSQCLLFYGLGLFAFALNTLTARVFYSLQDMATPLKVNILGLVINISLAFLLKQPLVTPGLALAFSISCTINTVILLILIDTKKNMIKSQAILPTFLKIFVISLVMMVFVWVMYKYTNLFFAIMGGTLLYGLLSYVMKMEEFLRLKELATSILLKNRFQVYVKKP